jgi:hypothetical protein
VQHEFRTRSSRRSATSKVIESRLIRLVEGAEVGRSHDLPLILAAYGNPLYSVRSAPYPRVVALEASLGG